MAFDTSTGSSDAEHLEKLMDTYSKTLIMTIQGEYDEAERLVRMKVGSQVNWFDKKHLDTVASTRKLAKKLVAQHRHKGTEEVLQSVLESQEEIIGSEYLRSLRTMHDLADVLTERGLHEEAANLLQKTYELRKKLLGPEDLDTLDSMHDLADMLTERDLHEEAKILLRQILKFRTRMVGPEDLGTLDNMHNLVFMLTGRGQYEEAEKLLRQLLDLRINISRPGHLYALITMHDLAAVLIRQSLYKEAARILTLTELSVTEHFCTDHPYAWAMIITPARTYEMQGCWDEACKLRARVVDLSSRSSGEEHPDTLLCMRNLAEVLQKLGRWTEAEEFYGHVVKSNLKSHGLFHPRTWISMRDLAGFYEECGRLAEATEFYEEVLRTSQTIFGEEHRLTVASMSLLARCHEKRGHSAEARELHAQASRMHKRIIEPNRSSAVLRTYNQASNSDQALMTQVPGRSEADGMESVPDLTEGLTLLSSQWDELKDAQELAILLLENETLKTSFQVAIDMAGTQRFEKNAVKLLRKFATELRQEAQSGMQEACTELVHSRARFIVSCLGQCLDADRNTLSMQQKLKGLPDKFSQKTEQFEESIVKQCFMASYPKVTDEFTSVGNEPTVDDGTAEEVGDTDDGALPQITSLEQLKSFITQSNAFLKLKDDVQGFSFSYLQMNRHRPDAQYQTPVVTSRSVRALSALKSLQLFCAKLAGLMIAALCEPTLRKGFARVRWTCTCGQEFHQDFIDTSSEAKNLFEILAEAGYPARIIKLPALGENGIQASSHAPSEGRSNNSHAAISRKAPPKPAAESSNPLPNQPILSNTIPATPRILHDENESRWVLLCFDFFENVGKAIHVDVKKHWNDRAMFRLFRREYLRSKEILWQYFSWKKVKEISFVQFQLMLDLRTKDDIPLIDQEWKPPNEWREYHQWDPRPRETPPNITNAWLLHLWEEPHDALAFRLTCKAKTTSGHICRSSHRAFKNVCNDIRMTVSRMTEKYRTYRGWEPDQLPTRNSESQTPAVSEITTASHTPEEDPLKDRGHFIFKLCPQKIIEPLQADPDDPPYGWGLYVKEGFAVPELVKTFALFLTFTSIFGVLGYCVKRLATVGFGVFGIWGATIGLGGLAATLLFRYADQKKS